MQILSDNPDHRRMVYAVMQAATDYHLLVEGAPPSIAHVDDFFSSVPEGYGAADLFSLGFFAADEMIGIGGVLRRWNAPNKAMIGLLILAPQWRGGGYGRAAVAHIEALARSWGDVDRLRVGVVGSNPDALRFWRGVGFIDTGEIKAKYPPYIDDIVILEKSIQPREK
jgi:GNAT superfamily N-acetyltransferase